MKIRPKRPGQIIVAVVAVGILATAAVALIGSTGFLQSGGVLNSAGGQLTGGGVVATVSLGESLVGPLGMTGGGVIMTPGITAKKKLLQSGVASDAPEDVQIPEATLLQRTFPNPFSSTATIAFGLAETGPVSIRIYDASGRMVRELMNGDVAAGFHQVQWDGRMSNGSQAASGVYFLRMASRKFAEQKKLILSR